MTYASTWDPKGGNSCKDLKHGKYSLVSVVSHTHLIIKGFRIQ